MFFFGKGESERSRSIGHVTRGILRDHVWLKILIGMFLGVMVGFLLSPEGMDLIGDRDRAFVLAEWFKLPGILFLSLLQMVVVPLVLCSIILGISQSGRLDFLKKLGFRIVPYFIMTTAVSISIGLVLVHLLQPSEYIDADLIENFADSMAASGVNESVKTFENLTIPQRIANILPTNLSQALVEKNLLQIVVASIIVGVALVVIPEDAAKPILNLCVSGQVITMTIIGWAMAIAPYAVFGLLCDITIKIGLEVIQSLGMYMLTVLLALVGIVCFYMLIVFAIGRRSPLAFLKGVAEAQIIAFSTSSSAATMPVSIRCAEENLKVKPEIARFVVPLGATINMDGTAVYQAIAAVFLVYVFGEASGIELSTMDLVLLLITTVGASIGTPATPGVGIAVLATILVGIGLNPAAVGFIFGVDRILDMCRTVVNVTGDLTASVVMDRWLGNKV